jgi:hypothetical protein
MSNIISQRKILPDAVMKGKRQKSSPPFYLYAMITEHYLFSSQIQDMPVPHLFTALLLFFLPRLRTSCKRSDKPLSFRSALIFWSEYRTINTYDPAQL